jgi:hypothetical protein
MTARASINQVTQIGVERVSACPVACNKRFPGVQITSSPKSARSSIEPPALKFRVLVS